MKSALYIPASGEPTIAPRRLAGPRLSERARGARAYTPPDHAPYIELRLDANEGTVAEAKLACREDAASLELARRYPRAVDLERQLADWLGVAAEQVLVTAGGDDAIDRACRAVLEPGRRLVLPVPTFEMIEHSAVLAGADVVHVSWPRGPYPLAEVLATIDDRTGMIAVVSPNNPTGAVATADDLRALSAAAPDALLLVDLAYTEFADEDLMPVALGLPNAVVIRTFSKAFGLAGLRVGYAVGPVSGRVIPAMRAMGSPFPVAGPSLAAASGALRAAAESIPRTRSRARRERGELARVLTQLGARPSPSQANFVLAEFDDAAWACAGLASLGIAVRSFPAGRSLQRSLRITCPGCPGDFDRLCGGLRAVMWPEAVLLDLDGVIADVSGSYRLAIVQTAAAFGVDVTPDEVAAVKAAGNANNDWVVTHRLLSSRGVLASLAEVTERFESLYRGDSQRPGLRDQESLISRQSVLEQLAARTRLGIVTGRPRADCERFLRRFEIAELFDAVVCMEDAALKPDPAPVRLALRRLGVEAAWMVGDTPDDIVAARSAGVLPLGVVAPGDGRTSAARLAVSGAALVLESLEQLLEKLP